MWFKLVNANFSNNNLGSMNELSEYQFITKNLVGFTETTLNPINNVLKNESYQATFILDEGYAYSSHSVTMNGAAVTSGVFYDFTTGILTVSIDSVMSSVIITAIATNNS